MTESNFLPYLSLCSAEMPQARYEATNALTAPSMASAASFLPSDGAEISTDRESVRGRAPPSGGRKPSRHSSKM